MDGGFVPLFTRIGIQSQVVPSTHVLPINLLTISISVNDEHMYTYIYNIYKYISKAGSKAL